MFFRTKLSYILEIREQVSLPVITVNEANEVEIINGIMIDQTLVKE
jgi:hypothetical protein